MDQREEMSACLFKKQPPSFPLEIFKILQYPYKDELNLPEMYGFPSHLSLHLATYYQKEKEMNLVPSEEPNYFCLFLFKGRVLGLTRKALGFFYMESRKALF